MVHRFSRDLEELEYNFDDIMDCIRANDVLGNSMVIFVDANNRLLFRREVGLFGDVLRIEYRNVVYHYIRRMVGGELCYLTDNNIPTPLCGGQQDFVFFELCMFRCIIDNLKKTYPRYW